ncbi:MAG: AraC family transcriptional regulator, partial [Lachnospiraceae bacterium]|nr:AraC family transcriptional regulator [Lachnospiraceae bacterium]
VYTLDESSLLFFDCRHRFRFDIAVSPWEYQILFFCGESLSYYCSLLPKAHVPLIQLPPYSELITDMKNIAVRTQIPGICSRLIISDLLNHMVTEYLTGLLKPDASLPQIPAHVREMKEMFDENFKDFYTLDLLEERFGISKYRLCREFSNTYQTPPLQYLNKKRIDHAAYLLSTTSLLVHEIGSMVGIDNTNHFITLFKKYQGVTPLEYRQRMTR